MKLFLPPELTADPDSPERQQAAARQAEQQQMAMQGDYSSVHSPAVPHINNGNLAWIEPKGRAAATTAY